MVKWAVSTRCKHLSTANLTQKRAHIIVVI